MKIECSDCGAEIISDYDLIESKNIVDGHGNKISECRYCNCNNFTIIN